MRRHRKHFEESLNHLWWLAPASIFALVIGSTMLAAAMQSDTAFRLYGTPKFIGTKHLLLAGAAIFVFALGRRLAGTTGQVPRRTPAATDSLVRTWFWITTGFTLFGYAVWLAVGVKNGFSVGTLREFLTTDDILMVESIRDEMFTNVKGVTTCTQFGPAAILLGLWLFFKGERWLAWPLGLLIGLAALRALVFSERLALIELVVPAAVVVLRASFLGRPLAPAVQWGMKLAPVMGIAALLLLFGSFEYFRSWRHYQNEFDSYAEFTLWRVSGYYTTAHNNSAMALETQPPFPIPYATVAHLWAIPGLSSTPFGYRSVTGIDPIERHNRMLEQFGTAELNNEGGLFQPALDFGLGGYVVFWFAAGFVAGRLYRGFQVGTLAGITLYPLVFLAVLETPRFLYLSYSRSLPTVVVLLFIAALASRSPKCAPVSAALPATA